MLAYLATDGCRMEYLRRELDDGGAAPCGRCDNCTGKRWDTSADTARAETARERLLRPGVEVEAAQDVADRPERSRGFRRKRQDQPLISVRTRPGACPDYRHWLGTTLRALLSPEAADGPVPDQVFDAVVTMLAAWDWAERPAGVVTMPSRSRPELIASLAQQISKTGRLPYLGALAYAGDGPGPRRHNSAQRVRSLWDALTVPGALREEIAALRDGDGGPGGPVLLVDDRIETGWTMTAAAKLLREAGIPSVLPLALAVTTG